MMIIAKKINDQNLFISELQKNCFTDVQDIKKKICILHTVLVMEINTT